jgi:uncharacterized protein YndB with AHSA1/START domain
MDTTQNTSITVTTIVNASVEKVWKYWNDPQHIIKWNAASDDWHTPSAENDFRIGGKSTCRMEAKDGSMGFDFSWVYTNIVEQNLLEYVLEDGRKVFILFEVKDDAVKITETFDAENTHPVDLQRNGWQAILNNFKNYVEQN